MQENIKSALIIGLLFLMIFSLSLSLIFGLVIGPFLSGNFLYWQKFMLDYRVLWFDAIQIAFLSAVTAVGSGIALFVVIKKV